MAVNDRGGPLQLNWDDVDLLRQDLDVLVVGSAPLAAITDATNVTGTAGYAKIDHTHSHGNRGGGSLHALAEKGGDGRTAQHGFLRDASNLEYRVLMQTHLALGGTTFVNAGFPTAPAVAGIATNAETANGRLLDLLSLSISGDWVGIVHPVFAQYRMQPYVYGRYRTGNLSDTRAWWGLANTSPHATAPPASTLHLAAFAWDSAVYTGNLRCITSDGSASTVTDSGVTAASSTRYSFQIECDTDATPDCVRFYIDNALVATHTTNLPGTSTNLAHYQTATTLTAASRNFRGTGITATSVQ